MSIYGNDGGQAFKINMYPPSGEPEKGEYYLVNEYGTGYKRGDLLYYDVGGYKIVGNILGDKGDIPNFEFTNSPLTGTNKKDGAILVGGKEVAVQTQLSEDGQTVTIYLSSVPYPDVEIDSAAQEYKWEEQEGKWIFGIPTPRFEITEDGEVKYQIGSGEPETIGQAVVKQVENIVGTVDVEDTININSITDYSKIENMLPENPQHLDVVRISKYEDTSDEKATFIRVVDWMYIENESESTWKIIRNYVDRYTVNSPQTHKFGTLSELPEEDQRENDVLYMVTDDKNNISQIVTNDESYNFKVNAENVICTEAGKDTTLDKVVDKACWYGLIDDTTGKIVETEQELQPSGEYTFFTSFNTGYVKDDTLILLDKYYEVNDAGVLIFRGADDNGN